MDLLETSSTVTLNVMCSVSSAFTDDAAEVSPSPKIIAITRTALNTAERNSFTAFIVISFPIYLIR